MTAPREFHAARWNEPLLYELGGPGRRGQHYEPATDDLPELGLPPHLLRATPPALPELSEYEVLRHFLHLSQETLGMLGISLFGTCTMKYNPRVVDRALTRSYVRDVHPRQDERTLQGALEVVHELDLMLRELSGMDRFVFEPGGGADAAYLHCCVTRAFHAARGDALRDEVITTAQAHPCNPATAAAAGFKVITIALESNGLPSLEALRTAVSDRTAALMINNPDDMGLYNPQIREWVDVVHDAGGLAFYDHANFNGVMTRIRARELGFDACMFMLHKTFGGAKGGGGPAVGAYGCTEELAQYLTSPQVTLDEGGYRLVTGEPGTAGRVREFLGNIPVIVRAYAWLRANGIEGLREAADLSLLGNNYMETRLVAIPGVEKAFPQAVGHRLEMTRYSLDRVTQDTGVTAVDIQSRMTDFGIDAFWLSHEPWIIPEPFTPEAGELWPREDLDRWVDVLAHVVGEAYETPDLVRTAPHHQPIGRVDASGADDPATWATTWRALQRKRGLGGDSLRHQ